eukprot:GEMP01012072.1.p1 GENE.GEMP01012072.1~~GEMP01012072.1.p1  ORF type:complete len:484 (+),score=82.38 GEMP01012072.1:163-1614(+)
MENQLTRSKAPMATTDTKGQEKQVVPTIPSMASMSTAPSSSRLAPWSGKGNLSGISMNILSPANADHTSAGISSMSSKGNALGKIPSRQSISDIVGRLSSISLMPREQSSMSFTWDCADFKPSKVCSRLFIPENEQKQQPQQHKEQSQSSELPEGLPSLGSAEHDSGNCRPCVFFHKDRGCHEMQNCTFCHLCTKESFLKKKKLRKQDLNQRRLADRKVNFASEHYQEPKRKSSQPQKRQQGINPRPPYSLNLEKTLTTMTSHQKEYSYHPSSCEPAFEFHTTQKSPSLMAALFHHDHESLEPRTSNHNQSQPLDHQQNAEQVATPFLKLGKQNMDSTLSSRHKYGMTSDWAQLVLRTNSPSDSLNQSIDIPQTAELGGEWPSQSEGNGRQDALGNGIPVLLSDTGKLAGDLRASDEEPGLASRSSYAAHLAGTCAPCIFVHKTVGCKKGDLCEYCHFCDQAKCRSQKTLQAKIGRQMKKRRS